MMREKNIKKLVMMAKEAANFAYAPYSSVKVGAAVMTKEGKIYTGCNVENSSFGAGVCAERTALLNAASSGERDFFAIAITSNLDDYIFPCGICRQFLSEFCTDDFLIICADSNSNYKEYTLGGLLPHAFRL